MTILTPEQFAAASPGTRRNYALKRGGSIDVGTAAGAIIVGSKRELTEPELAEATAIVAEYTTRQAKLAADRERVVDRKGNTQPPTAK